MLVFWDVNSIWELEGGISAQEKIEATEGEKEFYSSRHIFVLL